MKMKKLILAVSTLLLTGSILTACTDIPTDDTQKTLNEQNENKLKQSAKVMKSVNVPEFNYSIERENIAKRLETTNNPNLLQWIYPMSAGRVIGRFPVRGKITSGSKRLTSTQMKVKIDGGEWNQDTFVEAPDEMGAYGSSDPYVFWFDPSGQYHQHSGDYFLTTEPYKLDLGNGTISVDIDEKELSKVAEYDKLTKVNGGK
jgi:hypothetical protein